MLLYQIAFRSLFRHKSRLALNLVLLVGAFTAIVVFKGFKTHILETMKTTLIETQFGDMQVAKSSFWDNAPVNYNVDKMITDPAGLSSQIAALPGIQYVSPRVEFYGLANTESKSIPARLIGVDFEVESNMQKQLLFLDGGAIEARKQIIVGAGLQKILAVKPGDGVTLVSPTIDGSINAMDVTVKGIFSAGFTSVDKETIFLNLKDAQKLYDSSAVNRLLIKGKTREALEMNLTAVKSVFDGPQFANSKLVVKSWLELADLYGQIEKYFSFQNLVIEIILLALVILGVSNTMNMVVFERLAEIGTLRALGDTEFDIQKLFLIEAVMLGLLAVCISIPLAYILMLVISHLEISILLPLLSKPIPVHLIPNLISFAEASIVCFFSVVIASLWPARKGSLVSIVVALRAKI